MSSHLRAEGTNSAIPETTTVFLMSCLQYIAVATIFSIGFPYKQGTHKNPVRGASCDRTILHRA